MVMVWFGNAVFLKVEFPTALLYAISEKIRKKPGGSNIRPSCPWIGYLLSYT
jgi:hypothetical protein